MGRSIRNPVLPAGEYYHRASNRHYRIADSRVHRHQIDAKGAQVNILEKSIDLIIGSGNHAATLVHRGPQGRLIELPVTRYASAQGGFYAMSPGYDRPNHLDFRREITDKCLFCHSAGAVPAPIHCGRCHGDPAAHMTKPMSGTILNPAKLSPQRQLETCLQCHLETSSREMPDSLLRPGRGVFSYLPGEPLSAYKVYFDRLDAAAPRFEINHAGYRLLHSPCFRGSGGRLTCTTCHDPHSAKVRNACSGCHLSDHAKTATDCAGCHMPKRRAQDAIHVTMTDHWIQRRPSFLDPVREDHVPYLGEIVPFYLQSGPSLISTARAIQRAERERTSAAYRALPRTAVNLALLGEALLREGDRVSARPPLESALRLNSTHPVALNALAVLHATEGRLDQALALLESSRVANPDHPLTWLNLGVTWEAKGDPGRSAQCYREAIRHQPDFAEARHRLAAIQASQQP